MAPRSRFSASTVWLKSGLIAFPWGGVPSSTPVGDALGPVSAPFLHKPSLTEESVINRPSLWELPGRYGRSEDIKYIKIKNVFSKKEAVPTCIHKDLLTSDSARVLARHYGEQEN